MNIEQGEAIRFRHPRVRAPARKRLFSRVTRERVVSVLSPLLLLAWEALVRMHVLDARFFPAPSQIVGTFISMIWSGELLQDVLVSLTRIGAGFLLGGFAGMVLGLLMGVSRIIRAAVNPLVGTICPIPNIAILPLVMLIFGLGEPSKYVIVAVGVFFLVLLNTAGGVLNIEKIYLDVGRNFGARRLDVLLTIALPGALPLIFTGLRLAWGTGLLLIVATEFISAKSGIGYVIWNAWQTFSVPEMYVGLITISVLGLFSFAAIDVLERWLIPWRVEAS